MDLKRPIRFFWVYLFPLIIPWAILFGVNAAPPSLPLRSSLPEERWAADHCSWDCHNRGCRHAPVLPAVITGDDYLFGATVHGLYALGSVFSRDRFKGYGIANIAVFCVAWPGVMYALWVIAWRQREELRRLRGGSGGRS